MTEPSTVVAQPLHDRVAIVTGGSRGMGRAISFHLASLGAKIVINYHSNSAEADLVATQINTNTTNTTTTTTTTTTTNTTTTTTTTTITTTTDTNTNTNTNTNTDTTNNSTNTNTNTNTTNINTNDSPRAITFQADVSDPAQVKSLFDAAESAFNSQPHILVNSA